MEIGARYKQSVVNSTGSCCIVGDGLRRVSHSLLLPRHRLFNDVLVRQKRYGIKRTYHNSIGPVRGVDNSLILMIKSPGRYCSAERGWSSLLPEIVFNGGMQIN
jgi:hypothetical protein